MLKIIKKITKEDIFKIFLLISFVIFSSYIIYKSKNINNSKNSFNQILNSNNEDCFKINITKDDIKMLKINKNIINISDVRNVKSIKQDSFDNINVFLSIPIIGLYKAPIRTGVSQEIMNKYIGHFENTSFDIGNVGLASHNRGAGANYFENLYKLKKGDFILYTYKNITRKYEVYKKIVIDSYDWSYLQKTDENILTMITCIKNRPNLRLCVQAKQV